MATALSCSSWMTCTPSAWSRFDLVRIFDAPEDEMSGFRSRTSGTAAQVALHGGKREGHQPRPGDARQIERLRMRGIREQHRLALAFQGHDGVRIQLQHQGVHAAAFQRLVDRATHRAVAADDRVIADFLDRLDGCQDRRGGLVFRSGCPSAPAISRRGSPPASTRARAAIVTAVQISSICSVAGSNGR